MARAPSREAYRPFRYRCRQATGDVDVMSVSAASLAEAGYATRATLAMKRRVCHEIPLTSGITGLAP